jgi:hypothetical protein
MRSRVFQQLSFDLANPTDRALLGWILALPHRRRGPILKAVLHEA